MSSARVLVAADSVARVLNNGTVAEIVDLYAEIAKRVKPHFISAYGPSDNAVDIHLSQNHGDIVTRPTLDLGISVEARNG